MECERSNWYNCNHTSTVIYLRCCQNVFWRWFTNAAPHSQYNSNWLWYLRLYVVNKGFFIEIQIALCGILYWNILVDSCRTIENIVTGGNGFSTLYLDYKIPVCRHIAGGRYLHLCTELSFYGNNSKQTRGAAFFPQQAAPRLLLLCKRSIFIRLIINSTLWDNRL